MISPEKILQLAALPLVLLVGFSLWAGLAAEHYIEVESVDGVWDLRNFDFTANNARLRGEVEFIPGALITPEEFAGRENEAVLGFPPETASFATSRVRIFLPDGGYYTFSRISSDFADRIFVNGVWLHDIGAPSNILENVVPFTARVTFTAQGESGVIEIVQQTSSLGIRSRNSLPQDWRVGEYRFYNTVLRADYTVNIVLGCYLALALIFLLLFFILRGYRPNLYFALFCAMWFLRSGVTGSRVFAVHMPWLPGIPSMRIEYLAMPVAAFLTTAIIRELFPGILHRLFIRTITVTSVVFSGIFIFGGVIFINMAMLVCQAVYFLGILYVIVRFAMKLRKPDAAQVIFIVGAMYFLYGAVRDFTYYSFVHILPPFDDINMTQIAMLTFAFCKAIALFMATMKEVEAVKLKERELAVEKTSLERVNHLKTGLMRTVSHEMRTPLAVMMGFAELSAEDLRKSQDNEKCAIAESLDVIAAEARRMTILLEELSAPMFLREFSMDKREISVENVIRKIAGLYEKVLERKNVNLRLELQDNLPTVYGNDYELRQVMFNLLRNADKHTKNGEIIVSGESREETGELVVTVKDTGAGIPQDLLPRLFTRGVSGEKGGMGFGLAICRDIIEAAGGRIGIGSEPGAGTKVWFTIPGIEKNAK